MCLLDERTGHVDDSFPLRSAPRQPPTAPCRLKGFTCIQITHLHLSTVKIYSCRRTSYWPETYRKPPGHRRCHPQDPSRSQPATSTIEAARPQGPPTARRSLLPTSPPIDAFEEPQRTWHDRDEEESRVVEQTNPRVSGYD